MGGVFTGALQGFGGGAILFWLALALLWAGFAWLAIRKWGRKAVIWVALSIPLMIPLAAALSMVVIIAICTHAANGCIGY